MVFLLTEGRKLVGYELILRNIPGALKTISSIPEKHRLNIEYIETCTRSKEIYWLFMAIDFTDVEEEVTPELILEEFRNAKVYVLDASIAPSKFNIVYPSRLCIKNIGGMRAILLGLGNMRGLINGIKDNMGEEMGNSFLYHLGYGVGKELYNLYAKPFNVDNLEDGVTILTALARGGGWADVYIEDIGKKEVILKVEGLWECDISRGKGDNKPKSNYVRGILAGFFEHLIRKKVIVKEVTCIGLGDPYCRFNISMI